MEFIAHVEEFSFFFPRPAFSRHYAGFVLLSYSLKSRRMYRNFNGEPIGQFLSFICSIRLCVERILWQDSLIVVLFACSSGP